MKERRINILPHPRPRQLTLTHGSQQHKQDFLLLSFSLFFYHCSSEVNGSVVFSPLRYIKVTLIGKMVHLRNHNLLNDDMGMGKWKNLIFTLRSQTIRLGSLTAAATKLQCTS